MVGYQELSRNPCLLEKQHFSDPMYYTTLWTMNQYLPNITSHVSCNTWHVPHNTKLWWKNFRPAMVERGMWRMEDGGLLGRPGRPGQALGCTLAEAAKCSSAGWLKCSLQYTACTTQGAVHSLQYTACSTQPAVHRQTGHTYSKLHFRLLTPTATCTTVCGNVNYIFVFKRCCQQSGNLQQYKATMKRW